MILAYLDVREINKEFIGGIMITNEFGIPKEFKYSEPIKPTKLQHILYGKVLTKYIKIDVLAKNLLSKVENKAELILTHDIDIAMSKEIEYNIVYLSSMANESMKKDIERIDENEIILKVSSFKSYRLVSKEDPINIAEDIKELSQNMDMDEPFNRMEKALDYIIENQNNIEK